MEQLGQCDYASSEVPRGYRCIECGKKGVKLWRDAYVTMDIQSLECAACALYNQEQDGPVDEDGRRTDKHGMETDQIGWRVPAVPTEDGRAFWGYTSVPDEGVAWWRRLPTDLPKA